MPRPREEHDWEDAADDDNDDADYDVDYDADADGDDDDESTIACPYCRQQIHEDAQRCPECGYYISAEDAPSASKRWWIVLGVALGLLAAYLWIAG